MTDNGMVSVIVDDGDDVELFLRAPGADSGASVLLDPALARRIARQLLHAADVADGLDADL